MSRFLTIKDATLVLGISEDTIRRRIKAGTLPAKQEQTTAGFRWLIELPDAEVRPAPEPDTGGAALLEQLRHTIALMEDERRHLWEEVEGKRREVSELHILLQRAQVQIQAPQAPPQDYADAQAITSAAPPQSHTQPPLRLRKWWQFWVHRYSPTAAVELPATSATD